MAQVDTKAPEFSPKQENPRERGAVIVKKSKIGLVPTEPDHRVRVICIVECKPWAHVYEKNEDGAEVRNLRALAKKEIVLIDADVADVLCANEHAARV